MRVSPVHAALREATARQHLALETQADVEARLRDPSRRAGVLTGLFAFHRRAEAMAAALMTDLKAVGLDLGGRADALAEGLGALHFTAPTPDFPLPETDDPSVAIGWLYVAEGSALGGRVMRKAMIRDEIDLTGLDFLDPHGDATGSRWMAFLAFMDAAVADGRATSAGVVDAAVLAFDHARDALVLPATVSRAA